MGQCSLALEVLHDERSASSDMSVAYRPCLLDDPPVAGLLEHADDVIEVQQRIGESDGAAQSVVSTMQQGVGDTE